MKFKLIVDHKTRQLYKLNEIKNFVFKIGRIKHTSLKLFTIVHLDILNKKKNLSKIRTRCFVTCRASAIYQKFQISRIKFRELVAQGFLPGLKKACW